jgi:hypothetical protein
MARWTRITPLLVLVQACSHRPWVSEAHTGTLSKLKRYVEVAADRHQFDRRRTEQLAELVAEREITTSDDREAYDRVLALAPCASRLFSPLLRQSARKTETAAAANITLMNADLMEPSRLLRLHISDADGAWRAVGVRASQRRDDRTVVQAALVDPDARVRHAAITTIRENPLLDDGRVLLDVIRLDPEMALRVFALSALAETGDTQSVLRARELWDAMEEPLRAAYLQALDAPKVRGSIGLELLSRTVQSDDAMAGEIAASLLYQNQARDSKLALARLGHALRAGTSSEQLLALATLRLREADLYPDVERLAREGAPYVRVAALEVLFSAGRDSANCRKRLVDIAGSGQPDASEADRVLAEHLDAQAIGRVEGRLSHPHARQRLAAARLLLKLQRWDAVALALADDHPAVRLSIACSVLSD